MKVLRHGKAVEEPADLVDRVALAIAETMFAPHELPLPADLWDKYKETARAAIDVLQVRLAEREAEIDRLRDFVRSARGIVQAYATAHPKRVWQGHEQDPLGAHAWLAAEQAEIGTMRDGGDPKVSKGAIGE